MKDVMIDIETMGTRSTSMIVQIGACYFDRATGEIGEKFKVNIHHNDDKFTVDWDTISWWMSQSDMARSSIIHGESCDMALAVVKLKAFLQNATYVWSHATFDIPIILNAFSKCNEKFPVHYTKCRDIRTLVDIKNNNQKSTIPRAGTYHDALDDCLYQVAYCVDALNK